MARARRARRKDERCGERGRERRGGRLVRASHDRGARGIADDRKGRPAHLHGGRGPQAAGGRLRTEAQREAVASDKRVTRTAPAVDVRYMTCTCALASDAVQQRNITALQVGEELSLIQG